MPAGSRRIGVLEVLALLAALSVLGAAVAVWVILGQSTNPLYSRRADVVLPDLAGLTREQAETALADAGLDLVWEEVYDPAVPAGRVCAQQPAAGRTVKQGQALTVRVSLGPQWITLPDLKGQPRDEALAALREQGLAVSVQFLADNTIQPYIVVRTEPAAGEQLLAGQAVKVTVSRPVPDPYRQVPDLTGMTAAEARAALRQRDLTAIVRPSGGQGTVRSQDPAFATLVRAFTPVYVYLG